MKKSYLIWTAILKELNYFPVILVISGEDLQLH